MCHAVLDAPQRRAVRGAGVRLCEPTEGAQPQSRTAPLPPPLAPTPLSLQCVLYVWCHPWCRTLSHFAPLPTPLSLQ